MESTVSETSTTIASSTSVYVDDPHVQKELRGGGGGGRGRGHQEENDDAVLGGGLRASVVRSSKSSAMRCSRGGGGGNVEPDSLDDETTPPPSPSPHKKVNPLLLQFPVHKSRIFYAVTPAWVRSHELPDGHMMRPTRLRLLHALVHSLGLHRRMTLVETPPATHEECNAFHSPLYIHVLRHSHLLTPPPPSSTTTTTTTTTKTEEAQSNREIDPLQSSSSSSSSLLDVSPPCGVSAILDAFQLDPVHRVGESDCPLLPSLWELISTFTGATLACCQAISSGEARIAINWSGGLHHSGPSNAAGFCYLGDVVLGIQRLLGTFRRVMYVDLDVHHGDGVEGAFRHCCRVLTLSLHQYGAKFFPGTGGMFDDDEDSANNNLGGRDGSGGDGASSFAARSKRQRRGASEEGEFYMNVPLPRGVGDDAYVAAFSVALSRLVSVFDPEAVVVQCGADSIAGDLIGGLCVTTRGHGACVAQVLGLNLPTVLLGGGGYHVLHTAKCWAVHTAIACGVAPQLPHCIPTTDPYYDEYRSEYPWREPTVHVELDVVDAVKYRLPYSATDALRLQLACRLDSCTAAIAVVRSRSYRAMLRDAQLVTDATAAQAIALLRSVLQRSGVLQTTMKQEQEVIPMIPPVEDENHPSSSSSLDVSGTAPYQHPHPPRDAKTASTAAITKKKKRKNNRRW